MALEVGSENFMQREKTDKPGLSPNLPHRDIATAQQLNSVLGVISALYPAVLSPWRSDAEDFEGRKTPTRTEAHIEAENAFRAACERLEKILADEDRWDTTFQKSLEKKYDEAFDMNKRFLDAQTEAAELLNKPHFKYRPIVSRLGREQFCAYVGDPNKPESFICGIGRSPAEALEAFDEFFAKGVQPNILDWMRLREQAIEAGVEPPDAPPEDPAPGNAT